MDERVLMRRGLLVTLPLVTALVIRTYPFVSTGAPFHTDTWPTLRNAEVLLKSSPTPLSARSPLDFYNAHWPGVSVYMAVISLVTSLPVGYSSPLYSPLVVSVSTLFVYLIAMKLLKNDLLSFLASLLFAAAGGHAIITAGVTKEAFANPLYLLLIYLIVISTGRTRWGGILATSSIIALSLVFSHHLTSLVALLVLAQLSALYIVSSIKEGRDVPWIPVLTSSLLAVLILLHYLLFAREALPIPIGPGELLTIASYQVVFSLPVFYDLIVRPRRISRTGLFMTAIFALALSTLAVGTRRPAMKGAPVLPVEAIMLVSPYLASALFALLALLPKWGSDGVYPIVVWSSSILGLEGYSVFGCGAGLGLILVHRLANFLYVPIALLSPLGVVKLLRGRKRVAAAIAILIAAGTSLQLFWGVVYSYRFSGGQHVYRRQDLAVLDWALRSVEGPAQVATDLRFKYLFLSRPEASIQADVADALKYVLGAESKPKSSLLLLSRTMWELGFVAGPYAIDLPGGAESKPKSDPAIVRAYENGEDVLYFRA